jgi:hypothetical protein
MKSRMSWLLGALCGAILMGTFPAAAKDISMRPLSRTAVESACSRAGGTSFGTLDEGAAYGCTSRSGAVYCEPDGTCSGSVSDLLPMPGHSLDAVLGAGERGEPIRIGPVDDRIAPRASAD